MKSDMTVELAPTFELLNESGKVISSKKFIGTPIVLFFYPGDLTSACLVQLSAVRDEWSKFMATGAHVFGVSHGTSESHRRFIKHCGLPFSLLVDEKMRTAKSFKATKTIGKTNVIRRTVVVIDRNGHIVYRKVGMPKHSDILKHLIK